MKKKKPKTPEQFKLRKPERWLKIHKGKTKYMTNHADSEDILIDQQNIEKVTEFKYLGQTTHPKDITKKEIYGRIRAAWSCFEKKKNKQKTRKCSKINYCPFHLKKESIS